MRIDTYIGIDPGVKTGVATYSKRTKKLIQLQTLNFWDTVDFLKRRIFTERAEAWMVIIEDPNAISAIYKRHNTNRMTKPAAMKIAQNVGANKREASLLIQAMEKYKIQFQAIAPIKSTKWTPAYFKAVTGWSGRTNEHTRDAARLIFGL